MTDDPADDPRAILLAKLAEAFAALTALQQAEASDVFLVMTQAGVIQARKELVGEA